jgi:hypothetical protein
MTTVPAEKYCLMCGRPEALEGYCLCDVCILIWLDELSEEEEW